MKFVSKNLAKQFSVAPSEPTKSGSSASSDAAFDEKAMLDFIDKRMSRENVNTKHDDSLKPLISPGPLPDLDYNAAQKKLYEVSLELSGVYANRCL